MQIDPSLKGGIILTMLGIVIWFLGHILNAVGEKMGEGLLVALFKRTDKTESSRVMYLTRMDGWRLKVKHLDLGDPAKTEIFKDFITIKLDVMHRRLMELSDLVRKGQFNRQTEFQIAAAKMVKEMVGEYEALAQQEKIPEVCIKRFEEVHRSAIDYMLMSVEIIGFSSLYDDSNERLAAIFYLYTSVLETSLSAYERTLTTLNGSLTGVEYKGLVVKSRGEENACNSI